MQTMIFFFHFQTGNAVPLLTTHITLVPTQVPSLVLVPPERLPPVTLTTYPTIVHNAILKQHLPSVQYNTIHKGIANTLLGWIPTPFASSPPN